MRNYMFLCCNGGDFYEAILFTFISLLVLILIGLVSKICTRKLTKEDVSYKIIKFLEFCSRVICFLVVFNIWGGAIRDVVLLILVLSIVFRNTIIDVFSNLVMKKERYSLGEILIIGGKKGILQSMNLYNFKMLELADSPDFVTTGNIITVPNRDIFDNSVTRVSREFKYVWSTLDVYIADFEDVNDAKRVLYEIIKNLDIIESTRKKAKVSIENSKSMRNIGNLEPVILTRISEMCPILSLRYVVDPRKVHYVRSMIYSKICDSARRGEIKLYKKGE